MRLFAVTLPVCGYAVVEVEAEDEKSAIEAAFGADITKAHIEEWDVYRHIAQGNVLYAPVNTPSAEDLGVDVDE